MKRTYIICMSQYGLKDMCIAKENGAQGKISKFPPLGNPDNK